MSVRDRTERGDDADLLHSDTLAVRPYTLTRGRTKPPAGVTVESLVSATPEGLRRVPVLAVEYRRILRLATIPISVAEAAAHTGTMVGVTKILVGDLVTSGLLHLRAGVTTAAPSRDVLERVLHGLESL